MKLFFSKKKAREADAPAAPPNQQETSPDQATTASGGLFARLKKTREGLFDGITNLLRGNSIEESIFDEIEDQLLVADLGVSVSGRIIQRLREEAKENRLQDGEAVLSTLRRVMLDILMPCQPGDIEAAEGRPTVVMMVGVNGVGKTTTLAKLASKEKNNGARVILAACDTFRAAAIEQLQTWGERLNIAVIAQGHGADAAAVAFDAYSAAKARGAELLLVDTAGRQHTHSDLVEQLKKIKRVLAKTDQGVPDEVWLTVDAGNGQNVLSQVAHFDEAVNLTGVCITKLDGTAKGGVVVALADRFGLPIQYIGVGESAEDLQRFDAEKFVDALMPTLPWYSVQN